MLHRWTKVHIVQFLCPVPPQKLISEKTKYAYAISQKFKNPSTQVGKTYVVCNATGIYRPSDKSKVHQFDDQILGLLSENKIKNKLIFLRI